MADSLKTPGIARISKLLGIVTLMIASASGCSHCRSTLTAFSQLKTKSAKELRARVMAKDVWDEKFAEHYFSHSDSKGLRAGFIDGFVARYMDRGNCPPLFAPNQDGMFEHGHNTCSTAWHNGYPIGSAEAGSHGYQGDNCARAHPFLRDAQLPVNPGCVRITKQDLLSDNRVNSQPLLKAADGAGEADAKLNRPLLSPIKHSLWPKFDSSELFTTAVGDRLISKLDVPRSASKIETTITKTDLGLDSQLDFATDQSGSKTIAISPKVSPSMVSTADSSSASDEWAPPGNPQR